MIIRQEGKAKDDTDSGYCYFDFNQLHSHQLCYRQHIKNVMFSCNIRKRQSTNRMRFNVQSLAKQYFLITFSEKQTEVIWVGPRGLIPTQDEKSPNSFSQHYAIQKRYYTKSCILNFLTYIQIYVLEAEYILVNRTTLLLFFSVSYLRRYYIKRKLTSNTFPHIVVATIRFENKLG